MKVHASASAQFVRWQRQHLAIRCALHAQQPTLIRVYLGLGQRLVREGALDDGPAQQRMLKLLLDTALDDALPWYWRSVCLEHAIVPLSRLQTLRARQAPPAPEACAFEARLQEARARLPAMPTPSTRPAP